MRTVLTFALAACVAVAPCVCLTAQAQEPWHRTLSPWRPLAKIYDDPLCQPFIQNLYAGFNGQPLKSVQEMWPEATLTTLDAPDESSRPITLDFDHDGDLEVMLIDNYNIGWRHLGIDLYVFASEADYAIAVADKSHYSHYGNLDLNGENGERVEGASYVEFGEFRDWSPLIAIGSGYYIVSGTSFIQLNAAGGARTVCEMEMSPPPRTYDLFTSQLPFIAGYTAAFGEAACSGTMAWRGGFRAESPFHDILSRPWILREPNTAGDAAVSRERTDAIRELRYISWGARDPQSWIDYLEIKQGRERFVAELRSYYLNYSWAFQMNEAEATAKAELAWRILLDAAYSTAPVDAYELTSLFFDPKFNLPITPDTPVAEIARLAIDAWLKAHPPGSERTEFDASILTNALLLAAETRQPMETIRTLANRRDEAFAAFPDPKRRGQSYFASTRTQFYDGESFLPVAQSGLDHALTAALGHAGLMNFFLERGANPSARTNYFGKTPLMYASQHDRLNAVRLLLDRGADANSKTDTANSCPKLERDHRTALMYAAENASEPVIDAMLKAGADVSAKDTQGNSALWYFGRNVKITDAAERNRIYRRLGG